MALGAVAVTGVTVFLRDTPAFGFLIALLAAMAAFNAALAVLLMRGHVKAAFIAGLALDTGSVLAGWTITTSLLAGTQQTNDIYLIFFPILVAGVARLGWPLGVVQAVLFIKECPRVEYPYGTPGPHVAGRRSPSQAAPQRVMR